MPKSYIYDTAAKIPIPGTILPGTVCNIPVLFK